jgi:hypothetical protein
MLCITACLCKTGADLRPYHGTLYRKSGDNLSIISVSTKVEQFACFFATYRLNTPSQSFAIPLNVISQSYKPSAHTCPWNRYQCRLYSNNRTADFAISTAATTLLHSPMKTHVTRRQAFRSNSEKQAEVEKQYFAWTARKAERRSPLNRTPFCYTSDSQPGVRTRTFRGTRKKKSE